MGAAAGIRPGRHSSPTSPGATPERSVVLDRHTCLRLARRTQAAKLGTRAGLPVERGRPAIIDVVGYWPKHSADWIDLIASLENCFLTVQHDRR